MKPGFIVAFGGPLVLVLVGYIAEAIVARYDKSRAKPDLDNISESVDGLLADAEMATQRANRDIAEVRARLLPAQR